MAEIHTKEWIDERTLVLASSTDSQQLETAASELAAADDPAAVDVLGSFLTDPAFLARLDNLEDPSRKMMHLSQVMLTLIKFASPEVVPLCQRLLDSEAFLADPDRKVYVLQALAEGGPMSEKTVEAFRTAVDEGYFGTVACLLAANASPEALALLLALTLDEERSIPIRVDTLHAALIPVRNRIPIIEFVGRLASKNPPAEFTQAAIESIYDFKPYWRRGHPAPPPRWRKTDSEALRYLVNMESYLKKRYSISAELMEAMERTAGMARSILARRGA